MMPHVQPFAISGSQVDGAERADSRFHQSPEADAAIGSAQRHRFWGVAAVSQRKRSTFAPAGCCETGRTLPRRRGLPPPAR